MSELWNHCWFGEDKISLRNKLKAYNILPEVLRNFITLKTNNCQLSMINQKIDFKNDLYVLTSEREDNSYLCLDVSKKGEPVVGKIGDVQVINSNFEFSWSSLVCNRDWFSSQSCSIIKPVDYTKQCFKLPTNIYGYKVKFENKILILTQNGDYNQYMGSCNSKIIHKKDQCFSKEIKLVGRRYHSSGIYLQARAKSHNSLGYLVISLNCTSSVKITIPCNNEYHYYMLSDTEDCEGVLDQTSYESDFNKITIEEHDNNLIHMLDLNKSTSAIYLLV